VIKSILAFALGMMFFPLQPCCRAQTDCGHTGIPLQPVEPSGLSTQQVIEKAAANESAFRARRNQYTYVEEIRIQTLSAAGLPGDYAVDGEYRQVMNVAYDASGRRLEQVTFAPQSTLRRVSLTMDDLEDIHTYAAFVLTPEALPNYEFSYAGAQHIDELDTYVFDVAPKIIEPKRKYYQGRIWIESHDLAIVKTCGKTVPDIVPPPKKKKKKKGAEENIHATYVTYREFIDGNWFPAYTRSDDVLQFTNGEVRMRQIIKYTDYKLSSAATQPEQRRLLSPDQARP
jgi:hypothetical protein